MAAQPRDMSQQCAGQKRTIRKEETTNRALPQRRRLSFPVPWNGAAGAGGALPVQVSRPTELACTSRDELGWHPGSREGLPMLKRSLALPIDLNEGFFEHLDAEHPPFSPDSLDVVLAALGARGGPVNRPDVVTWRGCLTSLATAALPHAASPFCMGVWRQDGVLFLSGRVCEDERADDQDLASKRFQYYGLRFEREATKHEASVRRGEGVCFTSIFKTRIGGIGIVAGAEIDAMEERMEGAEAPDLDGNKARRREYVELKSFFAGVPTVLVGLRNVDGIVHEVKRLDVLRIPGKATSWDADTGTRFVAAVLKWLCATIVEDGEDVMVLRFRPKSQTPNDASRPLLTLEPGRRLAIERLTTPRDAVFAPLRADPGRP